jgi:hypothetical protein
MPAGAPEAQGTRYGFRLFEFDVKWEIRDGRFAVVDVVEFGAGGAGTADSAEAAGAAGD